MPQKTSFIKHYIIPECDNHPENYIDELHNRWVFDTTRPPLDCLPEANVLIKDNIEMLMHMHDQVDILALRERRE